MDQEKEKIHIYRNQPNSHETETKENLENNG